MVFMFFVVLFGNLEVRFFQVPKIQDLQKPSKIQETKFKIKKPRLTKIQHPKSKFQKSKTQKFHAMTRQKNRNKKYIYRKETTSQTSKIQKHKLKTQNQNDKIQFPKSKIQIPKSKLQSPNLKIQNPRSKLQSPNHKNQTFLWIS